jgi:anti-sigma factor RsiW
VDACERYLNAIHELVDGTLGPIRRAELELHLESCDGCRALAADLQEIARSARSLDVLEPPERVWKSIAGRLRTERGVAEPSGALGRHRSVAMLAIAATLVFAIGASLFLLREPATTPQTPTTAQAPGQPAPGNAPSEDPVQSVVKELAVTEKAFQNLVEASEATNTVDPKTSAALKKNLLVMNEAINETRKALDADPQSAPARTSLYEVLKQKIQFLQDTIALMNELRQGDAAGAAEIVESGKS